MTDLPETYGRTRLTLMEVDPFHLYAYWEVTSEDWRRAGRISGAWILRFHEGDGGRFDVPIDPTSPHRYLEFPRDERAFVAEIGVVDVDGAFIPLCRSNAVSTPRSTPARRYDPRWMSVPGGEVDADVPVPLETPPSDLGCSSGAP